MSCDKCDAALAEAAALREQLATHARLMDALNDEIARLREQLAEARAEASADYRERQAGWEEAMGRHAELQDALKECQGDFDNLYATAETEANALRDRCASLEGAIRHPTSCPAWGSGPGECDCVLSSTSGPEWRQRVRAEAFEEAAKVADDSVLDHGHWLECLFTPRQIAAAIRALKTIATKETIDAATPEHTKEGA